jgi:trans-2-enoyl-CoA reductase
MSPLKILAAMALAAILIIPAFPIYVTYQYSKCVDKLVEDIDHEYIADMKRLFRGKVITIDQAYFYNKSKALECTVENLQR